MRKNNFFLLIILLISSCTKAPGPKTLISKWEKKYTAPFTLERTLASSGSGQCLQEIFGVDLLKTQISEIEKNYASASKVSGQWKHLNLSDLPISQANFLKSYGSKIGDLKNPESIDYSSCQDVPCIYNKIYNKDDHVAGYVHYLWYLRMGHMLSADNFVPGQTSPNPGEFNGKSIPLSQYLYNDDELYALWRLSMMLKPPHTNLSYLKEVQRVPRGEKYEKPEFVEACGLANSSGWITLQDGCLRLSSSGKDNGYLYTSVIHELTHQLDFQQGKGTNLFYRSHRPDYLEIAGLFLSEFVKEDKTIVRSWKHKEDIKLITKYAGTNPQENFAESIAYFRTDGDRASRDIDKNHYGFVSDNYFHGKNFKKTEIIQMLLESYTADASKSAFEAVIDCSKVNSSPKSVYFKAQDFSTPVMTTLLNCVGTRAQEMSKILKAKISMNEPEGCSSINEFPGKAAWDGMVKNHLQGIFNQFIQELHKDKDYLARIDAYYAEIKDKTIARTAYINCYAESSKESCFNSEIRRMSAEKASQIKLPPAQLEEMVDMYVSYHSFQSIKEETATLYKTFVKSHQDLIRTEAMKTWEGCLAGPQNDDDTPYNGIFRISDGYMVSSLYNCLNENLPETLKFVIKSIQVDGTRVEHPNEELLLKEEVKPELLNVVTNLYEEERNEEIQKAFDIMSEDEGKLRRQVLSDFSWVKNIIDNDKIMNDCKRQTYSLISHPALFNLKKDLFSNFAGEHVCANIQLAPEFNKWLQDSKDVLSEKIVSGLDDKMLERAQNRATFCLQQYPVSSAIQRIRFKKDREDCLINHWPVMESQLIEETLQDPVVLKFKIPPESIRGKMEMNRRRLQIRILKERFS